MVSSGSLLSLLAAALLVLGAAAPVRAAVDGVQVLGRELPLALRDGRMARVTLARLPFEPDRSEPREAVAAALARLVTAVPSACLLSVQLVGRVDPAREGETGTLGLHRLARERAEALQRRLVAAGIPAGRIAAVWDWQLRGEAAEVLVWLFALDPEDCEDGPEGAPLAAAEETAATAAAAGGPPASPTAHKRVAASPIATTAAADGLASRVGVPNGMARPAQTMVESSAERPRVARAGGGSPTTSAQGTVPDVRVRSPAGAEGGPSVAATDPEGAASMSAAAGPALGHAAASVVGRPDTAASAEPVATSPEQVRTVAPAASELGSDRASTATVAAVPPAGEKPAVSDGLPADDGPAVAVAHAPGEKPNTDGAGFAAADGAAGGSEPSATSANAGESPAAAKVAAGASSAPAPGKRAAVELRLTFAVNSSYLGRDNIHALERFVAALGEGRWAFDLSVPVGPAAAVRARSRAQAEAYERWLAERRARRLEGQLRRLLGARLGEVRVQFRPDDPSRTVVVRARRLGGPTGEVAAPAAMDTG